MELFPPNTEVGLSLAKRVHSRYAPAFEAMGPDRRAAAAMYFLPHRSAKAVLGVTRPRVVKWYCPFADQRSFPSGHRYCINVYTGCSHRCVYCYAAGYLSLRPRPKSDYRRLLRRDLEDLEQFDVPPAPLHLSNSTDAFQHPLETRRRDGLYTLQTLLRRRRFFTTITLLTKNPAMLARPEYLQTLRELHRPDKPVVVEVSLAFWRPQVSREFDPGGPSPSDRLAAMAALTEAGLPVVLRLSPVFPLDRALPDGTTPQPAADMARLVAEAVGAGAVTVVYTPAKIVQPQQGPLHPRMRQMLALYRRVSGSQRLLFRGGSWRLGPSAVQRTIVAELTEICTRAGAALAGCREHLLATR